MGVGKDHRCGATWAQLRLAFPTTIPQPQDRIRLVLAPQPQPRCSVEWTNAQDESTQIRLAQRIAIPVCMSWIHPLQYTDLGEKEVNPQSQPPGPHRRGETRPDALGLQARGRHARRFNSKQSWSG